MLQSVSDEINQSTVDEDDFESAALWWVIKITTIHEVTVNKMASVN
jgi:hypothetical protein